MNAISVLMVEDVSFVEDMVSRALSSSVRFLHEIPTC